MKTPFLCWIEWSTAIRTNKFAHRLLLLLLAKQQRQHHQPAAIQPAATSTFATRGIGNPKVQNIGNNSKIKTKKLIRRLI
jgi:hypothetical protein